MLNLQKLNKRKSILPSTSMKERHRERLVLLFRRADAISYMSNEESDAEEEQSQRGLRSRLTKPFPWESERLRKLKKKMDKVALSTMTERQRRICGKVSKGRALSQRPIPPNAPEWAVLSS